MKKYLLISLLLHSAIFLKFISNNDNLQDQNRQEGNSKTSDDSTYDIIPLSSGGKGDRKKINNCYYYGIGIRVDQIFTAFNGEVLLSYRIKEVVSGYSADSAGLQSGDVIIKINQKKIDSLNDIIGVKEGHMTLTVMRGSSMLILNLKRTKVYCD